MSAPLLKRLPHFTEKYSSKKEELWACINLSGTFSWKSFLRCVDHTLLITWRDVNWPSPSPDSHQQSAAQPR